jgi:Carboxypeptidase regulatory-like domain
VAAVFVGTPISVRNNQRPATPEQDELAYWAPRTFKFSLETSFLGLASTEAEVSTGLGGGDCGYDFTIGQRYLVYAYRSQKGDRLTTSICTRTNPIEKAGEDIEFLRSLQSRQPGVTISGEVRRRRQNVSSGDASSIASDRDFTLVIEGEHDHQQIQTGADGRFSLTGLASGKFKITLQLPDELTTYKTEQEITVADRGCASVFYSVMDNGRLSGRVLDSDGQPAAGVLLALMEKDHVDPTKNWGSFAKSEGNGQFKFSALPPGQYVLAINLSRYPEPTDPTNAYPRSYYPGVADISRAEVITLGAGENHGEITFQLPARREPSTIRGKVVWDDGTPVSNAGIDFREVTYHDSKMNNGMNADDQGYFTIKAFVGQTFVIEARSNRQYDGRRPFSPMERVEPLRLVVSNSTETVKIVLTKLR